MIRLVHGQPREYNFLQLLIETLQAWSRRRCFDRSHRHFGFLYLFSHVFSVQRNLHPNHHLPSILLVVFVYFMAAGGVSSTFVSSFTFAGFNDTISWSASINALTTAPTKIPAPADVSDFTVLQIQVKANDFAT